MTGFGRARFDMAGFRTATAIKEFLDTMSTVQQSIIMPFRLPLNHTRYIRENLINLHAIQNIIEGASPGKGCRFELDSETLRNFKNTRVKLTGMKLLPNDSTLQTKRLDVIKMNLSWRRVKYLTRSLQQQRIDIEKSFQTSLLRQQAESQRELEHRLDSLYIRVDELFSQIHGLSNPQDTAILPQDMSEGVLESHNGAQAKGKGKSNMADESGYTGDTEGRSPALELAPESHQASGRSRHVSSRLKEQFPSYRVNDIRVRHHDSVGEGRISQHSGPSQELNAARGERLDLPPSNNNTLMRPEMRNVNLNKSTLPIQKDSSNTINEIGQSSETIARRAVSALDLPTPALQTVGTVVPTTTLAITKGQAITAGVVGGIASAGVISNIYTTNVVARQAQRKLAIDEQVEADRVADRKKEEMEKKKEEQKQVEEGKKGTKNENQDDSSLDHSNNYPDDSHGQQTPKQRAVPSPQAQPRPPKTATAPKQSFLGSPYYQLVITNHQRQEPSSSKSGPSAIFRDAETSPQSPADVELQLKRIDAYIEPRKQEREKEFTKKKKNVENFKKYLASSQKMAKEEAILDSNLRKHREKSYLQEQAKANMDISAKAKIPPAEEQRVVNNTAYNNVDDTTDSFKNDDLGSSATAHNGIELRQLSHNTTSSDTKPEKMPMEASQITEICEGNNNSDSIKSQPLQQADHESRIDPR